MPTQASFADVKSVCGDSIRDASFICEMLECRYDIEQVKTLWRARKCGGGTGRLNTTDRPALAEFTRLVNIEIANNVPRDKATSAVVRKFPAAHAALLEESKQKGHMRNV